MAAREAYITGVGQCKAALDLCRSVPADRKQHFECPKVGHYGVFNGSRFRREIAPRISAFARRHDPCTETGFVIPSDLRLHTWRPFGATARSAPAGAAFSFGRGDNDEGTASGIRATPAAGSAAETEGSAWSLTMGASLTPLHFWQAAGAMMLDSIPGWGSRGR